MILLLDADKEAVQYCLKDNDRTIEQGKEQETGLLKEKLCRFNKDHEIKALGYRVQNAGQSIDRSVMELSPSLAAHIGESPCFGPGNDMLIKELFNFCSERFESCRHFVVCDSAFFLNMPQYARSYAIVYEYTEGGLVRYPRNGIVHEWAVKKLAAVKAPKRRKIITVFLNDGADVVALKGGRPVMTSQGFSDFDGIISQTGCGPVDTSIVFQLFCAGYSVENIYQVLSQESGFKALGGPQAALAQDIFSYQLIKTIGACVAVLEGVDAIVFIGDDQNELRDWTWDFLRQMEFLGLKRRENRTNEDALLTSPDSPIGAYYLVFDKWSVIARLLAGRLTHSPALKPIGF